MSIHSNVQCIRDFMKGANCSRPLVFPAKTEWPKIFYNLMNKKYDKQLPQIICGLINF